MDNGPLDDLHIQIVIFQLFAMLVYQRVYNCLSFQHQPFVNSSHSSTPLGLRASVQIDENSLAHETNCGWFRNPSTTTKRMVETQRMGRLPSGNLT